MAKTELNKMEEFEDTLTQEERDALGAEDDFEIDGEFEDMDVKLAQETIRERLERETDDEGKAEGEDGANDATEDATDGEEGQPEGETEAAEEGDPAQDEGGEEVTEGAADPDEEDTPRPAQQQPDMAKLYDAAMAQADKDIETNMSELSKKLEDMDITTEEFNAEVAKLNASRRDRINANVAEASFDFTVGSYLSANPTITDQHVAGLNAVFATIDGNPLYQGLSDYDKIGKAHEIYHSQVQDARARGLNIPDLDPPASKKAKAAVKADPKPEAAKEAPKPDAKTPPKQKTNTPPKTLRNAPASDSSADGADGKSAMIEKILNSKDPDAIEKALLTGKITTDDLEAFG